MVERRVISKINSVSIEASDTKYYLDWYNINFNQMNSQIMNFSNNVQKPRIVRSINLSSEAISEW